MQFAGDARALADPLFQSHIELPRDLLKAKTPAEPQHQSSGQGIGKPEPPGAPPRRKNHNADCGAVLRPAPLARSGFDMKDIFARCKSRIACEALRACNFIPTAVESLEPVTIAGALRIAIIEGGEFERQRVLTVGEGQSFSYRDRFFKRRACSDGHGFIGDLKIGEDPARNEAPVMHCVGRRGIQSIIRAEVYLTRTAFPGSRDIVSRSIGTIVVIERPRSRPEVRESVNCSDP